MIAGSTRDSQRAMPRRRQQAAVSASPRESPTLPDELANQDVDLLLRGILHRMVSVGVYLARYRVGNNAIFANAAIAPTRGIGGL